MDCDDVSTSNVNRQVLFSCKDVGRRKTEAAIDGLEGDRIRTSQSSSNVLTLLLVYILRLSPLGVCNSIPSNKVHGLMDLQQPYASVYTARCGFF